MKPIVLKLAPAEVNIIGAALGRLPHDDVNALIIKIGQQVQAQMAPKSPPAEPKPAPKK